MTRCSNNKGRDGEISTQATPEDMTEKIIVDREVPTQEQIDQENLIINPDPDSMDMRG